MEHREFKVGLEFFCDGKRWRCTDVGTRVVVAICLEPHTIRVATKTSQQVLPETAMQIANDPSWHHGPPYAVPEIVFDEYAMEGCTP